MITTYVNKKNSIRSKASKKSKKSKNKANCRKSNSLGQRNKPLKESKKALQEELKKINKFRKILTKNSKIYAKKYGKELLNNLLSLNIKSNRSNKDYIYNNKDFIYNNKNKTKIAGRRFFSSKNNVISKIMLKTLMERSPKNININTNIITSFKVINENVKRTNSYEKEILNNYLKKYKFFIDANMTNKKPNIDKTQNNQTIIRYYSFSKKRKSPRKKVKSKFIINYNKISRKTFEPETIQLYHNISLNFSPPPQY